MLKVCCQSVITYDVKIFKNVAETRSTSWIINMVQRVWNEIYVYDTVALKNV
jgi:hypothetical protein